MNHVVDLGLPVRGAAHGVLDVVAAVGEDPRVLALVLQLREHLLEAEVAADGVVQVRHEYDVIFSRVRDLRAYGDRCKQLQDHDKDQQCRKPLFR